MSADLWAAFSESDDLSKNPWNQASPTQAKPTAAQVPQEVGERDATRQDHLAGTEQKKTDLQALQSPWSTSHITSPVHQSSSQLQNQASDGWNDSAGASKDIWSGWESPTVSASAWRTEYASNGRACIESAQGEIANATDDWGDFENPQDELTTSIAGLSTKDSYATTSSKLKSISRTKSRQTSLAQEASQQQKPVSIDSDSTSANSRISIARANATEVARHHRDGPEPTKISINDPNLEIQDEWSEWSPEATVASDFSGAIASKGASDPTLTAQLSDNPKAKPKPEAVLGQNNASPQKIITVMPPTNVPPPSILISLISGLVEKLPKQIDSAMQTLPQSGGSNQALEPALRKCIAALRVAARVIAGRKLRWKRDTHLAQSMRIGQAGKGMKLSGVDRNEVKREDREAAEFVQIWQKRLGGIRRALALVNSQISGSPLALPEVSETMLVRTAKLVDGGISAPKCCVLCGIKRDERIEKVDGVVYDSFSEWWTEHWGHTDCKVFWSEHERYLRQR